LKVNWEYAPAGGGSLSVRISTGAPAKIVRLEQPCHLSG
jgi:hypothetical protein